MRKTGWLLMLLGGCATVPDGGPIVAYTCERGPELLISYSDNVARIMGGPGAGVELPQQVSGSGFRYGNATHSIRGKGDELIYTIGRMAPITCRAKR